VLSFLARYLVCEFNDKKGTSFDLQEKNSPFNIKKFTASNARAPVQDNHCDCGVYLLEYVERFFKDLCTDSNGLFDEPDSVMFHGHICISLIF
jgi:Ulp1 family protease